MRWKKRGFMARMVDERGGQIVERLQQEAETIGKETGKGIDTIAETNPEFVRMPNKSFGENFTRDWQETQAHPGTEQQKKEFMKGKVQAAQLVRREHELRIEKRGQEKERLYVKEFLTQQISQDSVLEYLKLYFQ
ncbi:MAG: hypothetical protein IIB07_09325 [Bacteroidetes bacterium]|nr:hypothetical protein [Bacteroidota bacterium]